MFGVTYIGSNYKQNKTIVNFLIYTWEFITSKKIIRLYIRRNSIEAKKIVVGIPWGAEMLNI